MPAQSRSRGASCILIPEVIKTSAGESVRLEAPPIGQGTYNAVFPTTDSALVARVSLPARHEPRPEETRREHALMQLFATEDVHPALSGISYAPERRPSSVVLMRKELPLDQYLRLPGSAEVCQALAQSLWRALCAVADAGICLMDIKPGNVLCDEARRKCYLIDFDQLVYMDRDLVEALRSDGDEAACARARGVNLCVMALLMRCHLLRSRSTERSRALRRALEEKLQRSELPFSLLTSLSTRKDTSFAGMLALNLRHYFWDKSSTPRERVYRWFLKEAETLVRRARSGEVVVDGRRYGSDDQGVARDGASRWPGWAWKALRAARRPASRLIPFSASPWQGNSPRRPPVAPRRSRFLLRE